MVYQTQRELSRQIFEITKTFPKEERYSLTDQIRRSSRSIGAQISEAWAKRRYEKSFISKLTDGDGEQRETEHWIETSADCGYITKDQETSLLETCQSIGRMLQGMINKSASFCQSEPGKSTSYQVREESSGASKDQDLSSYFIN